VRKSVSLLVLAAASTLLLTACAGGGGAKAKSSPKPSASSVADSCSLDAGTASKAVKVTGDDQKTAPQVTFDKGLKASKAQRSVDIAGTGEKAEKGRTVTVALTAYNGTTGDTIAPALGYDASQAPLPVEVGGTDLIPAISSAVECENVGSRVTYVAPATTAMGGTQGLDQYKLKSSDSVVFVVDILSMQPKALEKANGADQPAQPGFPTVKLSSKGKPTITIPKTQTVGTTTTAVETLKKGTGATVQSGDQVTVNYTGVIWGTGKQFDSSWDRGQTATFATDQVVPGFGKALVGQTVGSQVVAVIPAAEGYGASGNSQAGISGTDTLVFVVDILATSSATQ
jgi:peptidylprolyl isomerase